MLDTSINEDIFDNLPSMPEVVIKVLKLLNNDTTPNMLLADAVAHDPAMSARILALANSPAYGSFSKPTKLDQAIGIIGRSMIKNIALECSFRSVAPLTGGLGKLFWENAIGCAVSARMIALETKLFDHEEAFIAGMLCPVGKSVLAMHYGGEYQQLLESFVKMHKELSLLEMEKFGFTNEMVGATLLKKWNLDQTMVDAILHHQDLKNLNPNSNEKILAMILNISAAFCEKSGIGQIVCNEGVDVTRILAAHLLHFKPEQMQQFYEQFVMSFENDRNYYLS